MRSYHYWTTWSQIPFVWCVLPISMLKICIHIVFSDFVMDVTTCTCMCYYGNYHSVVFNFQAETKLERVCRVFLQYKSWLCVHGIATHSFLFGVRYHADSRHMLFIHSDTLFWIVSKMRQTHSGTFTYLNGMEGICLWYISCATRQWLRFYRFYSILTESQNRLGTLCVLFAC